MDIRWNFSKRGHLTQKLYKSTKTYIKEPKARGASAPTALLLLGDTHDSMDI
jgi:hypothetical protein